MLDDLFELDLAAGTWTELKGPAVQGAAPSARWGHGFASSGNLLFVFGGMIGGWIRGGARTQQRRPPVI
jgi:hypothetical protein